MLPFAVLLWSSFQRFYAVPSMEALQNLTLDPYRFILTYPNLGRTVWNSLLLVVRHRHDRDARDLGHLLDRGEDEAAGGAGCSTTSRRCRWCSRASCSGLAIMIFYLNVDIGVYGTIWIMFIAYITRFMPYGLRYNTTSMLQIHKELEESAAMSGASWSTTFRRIILPLLKPGLLAGLDLRDDRLDPRAVDVDPALQPRHAGGLDRDLGAVGEWPVRGALGARRAASS